MRISAVSTHQTRANKRQSPHATGRRVAPYFVEEARCMPVFEQFGKVDVTEMLAGSVKASPGDIVHVQSQQQLPRIWGMPKGLGGHP